MPSVARGISALRAAISRTEMLPAAIFILPPPLRAQIAIWRSLREIK
jgi:hypothetical protein